MKKAFTLVEMMVVVLLFGVILAAVFSVMSSGRNTWNAAETRISLRQDLRRAMREVAHDIRQTAPLQINISADGLVYNSVSFKVPSGVDGSGNIVWDSTPISFVLSSGQIIKTQASETRVLGNNITSLGFVRNALTPGVININISSQRRSKSGQLLSASAGSDITFRNF